MIEKIPCQEIDFRPKEVETRCRDSPRHSATDTLSECSG